MAKVAVFRDLSADQLSENLIKLKKEQFNLRFQKASGQLENTARRRAVRRDIARILTVLSARGETPNISTGAKKPAKKK